MFGKRRRSDGPRCKYTMALRHNPSESQYNSSFRQLLHVGFKVAATRANHKQELKDKNWTSTQTVENAFSLFKRGIVGNYHQLSREHLDRYLGEFCWRYNRRSMQPWLFEMTLTNLVNKKPLPYKDLTF